MAKLEMNKYYRTAPGFRRTDVHAEAEGGGWQKQNHELCFLVEKETQKTLSDHVL